MRISISVKRLKSIKEYMKEKKIRDVAAEFVCVDISFHDRFVFVTKKQQTNKRISSWYFIKLHG